MSVKITVYNATYSKELYSVGGFDNAQSAAHYRDNSGLAGLPTKLEQDTTSNHNNHNNHNNQPTVTHLMDTTAGDGSTDNWRPRVVPSTAGDNIKDFIIRFLLIGGLIAILALGVINFLIGLVPVQ